MISGDLALLALISDDLNLTDALMPANVKIQIPCVFAIKRSGKWRQSDDPPPPNFTFLSRSQLERMISHA